MSPKKEMPEFQDEEAYGRWMREHQDELEDYIDEPTAEQSARAEALLAKLPPRKKPAGKNITIRLSVADIEEAKAQAEIRGLPYQTLLKSIIHQGLEQMKGQGR